MSFIVSGPSSAWTRYLWLRQILPPCGLVTCISALSPWSPCSMKTVLHWPVLAPCEDFGVPLQWPWASAFCVNFRISLVELLENPPELYSEWHLPSVVNEVGKPSDLRAQCSFTWSVWDLYIDSFLRAFLLDLGTQPCCCNCKGSPLGLRWLLCKSATGLSKTMLNSIGIICSFYLQMPPSKRTVISVF